MEGRIIKGIGGFYYVAADDTVVQCRARGLFRKEGVSPQVGDMVELSPAGDGEGRIDRILPRRNLLVRPPLANLDRLFIIVSVKNPAPVLLVVDKLLALCEHKEIEPVLCLNKTDLADGGELAEIYEAAGYPVYSVSAATGAGIEELRSLIGGKLCAFSGNSGVGKSSILNRIDPAIGARVGELSEKLERGKHTTRHVELFSACGGYVADTPGFADISPERFERISAEELQYAFREFAPLIPDCRFTGCSHRKEAGCAVRKALEEGKIHPSRYESYAYMYDEVKDVKKWEMS